MSTRNFPYRLLFALSFLALAGACGSGTDHKEQPPIKPKTVIDTSMAGSFSPPSSYRFDSSILDTFFKAHQALIPYAADVKQFYQSRDYAYAWHDTAGLIEQAGNLHNRIRSLTDDGIPGEIPYTSQLDTLMSGADTASRLQSELLLTSMYFYFAEKAWTGLNESQTRKMDWFVPRKKASYLDWLHIYLSSPDSAAKEKEPIYRQYFLLKRYLRKYMTLQQQDTWKPVTEIKDIKKRLQLLGDLDPASDTTNKSDTTLAHAVKNFQRRHGLKQDGKITKTFLAELNTPLTTRINQILVNMERSRWLPDTVQGNYLAINIPEFKLHMYRDDSLLWDMNVVVGQSVHKTVIFSGALKHVVFSPYWNVPPGILQKEVLPGIKKDKSYLARHHMEWNGGNVRQTPGPWNSLGGVKFLFPNSYNIYLHDTPAKDLFGENDRAFSHGCIRLAEPAKLAAWLLRDDSTWTPEKIRKAMHAGAEKWVTVKYPFRVFIVYFTAWVDRQGALNFRKDIYGRDSRLEKMIIR